MSDFGLTIDESMATPFDLTAHDRGHLSRASDPSRDREGAGQLRPARAPTPLQSWLGNDLCQGPFAVDYAMGNLIGATEALTDDANEIVGRRVYTAFGELVSSSFMPYAAGRYGYAGAWGYQEGQPGDVNGSPDPLADLGWLHVGARYYDPAAGRFMQRDPIGIRGGMNTYEYVMSRPTSAIDPSGLDTYNPFRDPPYWQPPPPTIQPPANGMLISPCANDALAKVYVLDGAPHMIEGALIADVVAYLPLKVLRLLGAVDDEQYQFGFITRDVTRAIHDQLKTQPRR